MILAKYSSSSYLNVYHSVVLINFCVSVAGLWQPRRTGWSWLRALSRRWRLPEPGCRRRPEARQCPWPRPPRRWNRPGSWTNPLPLTLWAWTGRLPQLTRPGEWPGPPSGPVWMRGAGCGWLPGLTSRRRWIVAETEKVWNMNLLPFHNFFTQTSKISKQCSQKTAQPTIEIGTKNYAVPGSFLWQHIVSTRSCGYRDICNFSGQFADKNQADECFRSNKVLKIFIKGCPFSLGLNVLAMGIW